MTVWQILVAAWLLVDVALVAAAMAAGRARCRRADQRRRDDAVIADLERAYGEAPAA